LLRNATCSTHQTTSRYGGFRFIAYTLPPRRPPEDTARAVNIPTRQPI